MRAQHAPPRWSCRLPPRARASTHLGEASAPKARGWGHHYDLNGNVASKSGEASYSWGLRESARKLVFGLASFAFSLAACGRTYFAEPGDGGPLAVKGRDGGPVTVGGGEGGLPPLQVGDGGPEPTNGPDGGPEQQEAGGGSPPPVYVDAGYYYGDGSFFVDGGAYPDLLDASSQGGTDAEVLSRFGYDRRLLQSDHGL